MAHPSASAASSAPSSSSAAPTPLATRVLLAFDDFSRAGRYVLQHLALAGATASALPHSALPSALAAHVHVVQYTQEHQLKLSVVTVATAAVDDGAALWTLADALVQWLAASGVASLWVVASLHLPQAKPHAEPLDNVYSARAGASDDNESDATTTKLQALDATWEITDAFLVRLLHWIRVEQAFATQLLVVKGYKPGRDGAGMRDALAALASALPLAVEGVSVDVITADADATKALVTQHEPQHISLYQ